ncbi:centlein [Trichomycterus rosablanca]|uniref:centlein n=1 Tax=Trichomycterus rosablanca TaxID=2290929 RepID=UPI002F35374C
MSSTEKERVVLLEEEIRSLSQELLQCQADKEFVWSLWKRLQVANPDLTQAVSLVVEREKQKAEAKDRKVLEILQAKDFKIQELEKEVTLKRQEVSTLIRQQRVGEEERGAMKIELAELQQTLGGTGEQLQECEAEWRSRMEELQEKSKKQEEIHTTRVQESEAEWRSRMEGLQEKSKKQEEIHTTRVQELHEDLMKVQGVASSLSAQLGSVQQQLTDREDQLQQLRKELQDLQALYVQSVEHAGEQAELIQQLEGLNLDTQQVLQSQERAHSTHSASYQKLYTDLSASYHALQISQEQLRRREASLNDQLQQKDQQLTEQQDQVQQLQQLQQLQPPHPHPPERSRASSPSVSRAAEQKIQQLEELLTLKTLEVEELRRAHAERRDRLRLIQTNYRAVREQLREVEDANDLPAGRRKRAEPWQLRQENSDAVWNELAFYKRENKKLLTEKIHLEEELDLARVQAATDRVTAQELRVRLQEERQDRRLDEGDEEDDDEEEDEDEARAIRLEQTVKKIESLEVRTVSLEREISDLREENRSLQEVGRVLCSERDELRLALQQARLHHDSARARVGAEHQRALGETRALRSRLEKSGRAELGARRAALRLRQEVGVLRAERDFHRNRTRRGRAHGPRPRIHAVSMRRRAQSSPVRDEWEDVGQDSENEDFSDSLESRRPAQPRPSTNKSQGSRFGAIPQRGAVTDNPPAAGPRSGAPAGTGSCEEAAMRKMRRMKRRRVSAALNQRLACLQRQLAVLQSASRAAQEEQDKRQSEVETLKHSLQASRQLAQKQACDLAVLQQQKAVMEAELEQWRKPRPPPEHPQPLITPPVPDHALSTISTLETEIKQLNSKLKSSSAEVTRQNSVIKGLKTELHDRDQRLKELQEKVSHCERDVTMKRQLVEDLRSRMKILQDSDRNNRSLIDDLEKKARTLSEEASGRRACVESLRRRLGVVTQEKQRCESASDTLREDLRKKEQKLAALHARLTECERSKVELEQAATEQMQMLTNQSTESLQMLQSKLTLAQRQHTHLRSFTQALVVHVDRDVRRTRAEMRRRRRERRKKEEESVRGGVSKSSMVRAQSIAASILNVSENDLASILNTDEEEDSGDEADEGWVDHVQQILQQQVVSADVLLEVVLKKMKENRVLMEELNKNH